MSRNRLPSAPDGHDRDVYWWIIKKVAQDLGSDGCTGVPEFHQECCLEHDVHWRTGLTVLGQPITDRQANRRFRQCIQSRSRFGRFSPMAWWCPPATAAIPAL